MNFKFLSNNETILFNHLIIEACESYCYSHIQNSINGLTSNRQKRVNGLGTFFIIEFEFDSLENSYFTTILFSYETLEHPRLTFRFKDERIMSLTLSHS